MTKSLCNYREKQVTHLNLSFKSLINLSYSIRHFSHVTKSRIFKILDLRTKADRNF